MTKKYIWLVAWILATALIVVLARQVDSTRLLAALNQADWKWLTLSIAANLCILPIGAMQWWVLLPPPPVISRMRMLRISSMTSMANNTTPAIVGHAAGGAMIAAEPGAGVFTGIRVIALDQVGVGIAKIVVLATTLAVAPVPGWVRTGLGVIIGGVAVMGAVLIGIGWLIKRTVPPADNSRPSEDRLPA